MRTKTAINRADMLNTVAGQILKVPVEN